MARSGELQPAASGSGTVHRDPSRDVEPLQGNHVFEVAGQTSLMVGRLQNGKNLLGMDRRDEIIRIATDHGEAGASDGGQPEADHEKAGQSVGGLVERRLCVSLQADV